MQNLYQRRKSHVCNWNRLYSLSNQLHPYLQPLIRSLLSSIRSALPLTSATQALQDNKTRRTRRTRPTGGKSPTPPPVSRSAFPCGAGAFKILMGNPVIRPFGEGQRWKSWAIIVVVDFCPKRKSKMVDPTRIRGSSLYIREKMNLVV